MCNKSDLVVNGKYNMKEIMKRAWMYVKNPFCTQYRKNFKGALKAAWVDARIEMDRYTWEKENENKPIFPKKGLGVADLYNSYNLVHGYVAR